MKKTVYLIKTKRPKNERPTKSTGIWLTAYGNYVPLRDAFLYDTRDEALRDTRTDLKDVVVEATLELTIK